MLFFIFIQNLKKRLFANSGELDQTPRFAASDQVLHCLSMSYKKDGRLIWVNMNNYINKLSPPYIEQRNYLSGPLV